MAKFYKFDGVLINLDNVTSITKIKRPIKPRKTDDNDTEEYEWGLYVDYISGSPARLFPSNKHASESDIDMYMAVIECL